MKCTNDYHQFSPFKVGSDKYQCQCKEFFIAPTYHGDQMYQDAWQLGQPGTRQVKGAPFKTLQEAIDGCNSHSGSIAA